MPIEFLFWETHRVLQTAGYERFAYFEWEITRLPICGQFIRDELMLLGWFTPAAGTHLTYHPNGCQLTGAHKGTIGAFSIGLTFRGLKPHMLQHLL